MRNRGFTHSVATKNTYTHKLPRNNGSIVHWFGSYALIELVHVPTKLVSKRSSASPALPTLSGVLTSNHQLSQCLATEYNPSSAITQLIHVDTAAGSTSRGTRRSALLEMETSAASCWPCCARRTGLSAQT